jgi:UDP-N-acetylmuramoylalanine--D-glutamate ligase
MDLSPDDLTRHAHAAHVAADLRGKRVAVMGMARSGAAAARTALRMGASVTCIDARTDAPLVDGCDHRYGTHAPSDFLSADLLIVSPGVAARHPELVAAAAAGVPLIGEMAFAAVHLRAPILAVSGTNGKSTATHLLGQLLTNAGRRTFVGGNIGRPLSEAVGEDVDVCIVEVSSYMMELPGAFRPRAAVVLNLTPDHLERHGTMDAYGAHKCRMFARMGPDDHAIVPADDPRLLRLADAHPGSRLFLGSAPGVRVVRDLLVLEGTIDDGTVALDGFGLPGAHNRANLAAALLMATCAGVRRADIDVTRLEGLAHRLEPVGTRAGLCWVNDSKATNVDSTLVALAAADLPRTVVLLGGKGKDGAPYHALAANLRDARAVVCFGAEGPHIAAVLRSAGLSPADAGTLEDAIGRARALACAGDTVLLSPACASFDQFKDFEHRGRAFRAAVEELPE